MGTYDDYSVDSSEELYDPNDPENRSQREIGGTEGGGRGTSNGLGGGTADEDYVKSAEDAFKDYFGTKSGPRAGEAMIKRQALQYMRRPETFGISEAEKQAAADKAAAASGAAAAGVLARGGREIMGGGTTGYAAQAMREAVEPSRAGAAAASQQAMEASKQMIEAKGKELYGELTGKPYMTVAGQIAAAAGQQAVESGVDLLADYAGQQLLGEPDDPLDAPDVDDMTDAELEAAGMER